ncbi:MAG: DNA polymerase III subunit delta [Chitinivibrionales bacterium]|nr:DNA polymerase III subunit delta [Chitinivibrionales bacterium]
MNATTQKNNSFDFPEGIPALIVLAGNEYVSRQRIRQRIFDAVAQRQSDYSVHSFDTAAATFESFVELMLSPSLFGTFRLFQIRDGQAIKEAQYKKLKPLFKHPSTDMTLIIETDAATEKALQKLFETLGIDRDAKSQSGVSTVYLCQRPADYQLPQWLSTNVPTFFNRTITKAAAEALIDFVGNDLTMIYSELQKLDVHLPDGAAIDQKSVALIVGAHRAVTPFELAAVLGQKDLAKAYTIIEALFHEAVYGPALIAAIFRHFWKILRIRSFAEVRKETVNGFLKARYEKQLALGKEIGVATGIMQPDDSEKKAYPIMVLSGIVKQAALFEIPHLRTIFTWLSQFDAAVKNGTVRPERQAFERLCYYIVHAGEKELKDYVP